MRYFSKFVFLMLLGMTQLKAETYITEIINNTDLLLTLEYAIPVTSFKVVSSVSLGTGTETVFELKQNSGERKTYLTIAKRSRVLLTEGAYIPDAKYDPSGHLCSGILLKGDAYCFRGNQQKAFALIRRRNDWAEIAPKSKYGISVCNAYFYRVGYKCLTDGAYVLEINQISQEINLPNDTHNGYKINEDAFSIDIRARSSEHAK